MLPRPFLECHIASTLLSDRRFRQCFSFLPSLPQFFHLRFNPIVKLNKLIYVFSVVFPIHEIECFIQHLKWILVERLRNAAVFRRIGKIERTSLQKNVNLFKRGRSYSDGGRSGTRHYVSSFG